MADLDRLRQYLANANVQAFLRVIRHCEGTGDDDGYRRMFGGKLFDSWADHPRQAQTFKLSRGGTLTSTAAGAYQFLSKTWDGLVKRYGFEDFSPGSQDLGAVALIDGRGALMDLVRGDIDAAVAKCNREWASLPGSPYGQPVKTMAEVRRVYAEHGGQLGPAGPKEDKVVAPFIAAALPALVEAVPSLIRAFGKGEVTERNAKAAELVMEVAKNAVGAKNEQELVERVQTDAEARKAVTEAVERDWFRIQEVGGGIVEARKFDLQVMRDPKASVWRSPSFIVALCLLPLAYMIIGAVVGLFGTAFNEDVRAAIANGVIGMVIGALSGYYFGSMTSRNRTSTPEADKA